MYNINMDYIQFDWNEKKNKNNIQKHGISFNEAKTVFWDEHAILISDNEHSEFEDRFLILGFSFKSSLLVVVHCYREDDEIIRIISARKATRTERNTYKRRL
jgi:uncharacterized DUF497 family protein